MSALVTTQDRIKELKTYLATDDIKTILADNYIQMILKQHPDVNQSSVIEHLNLVQQSGANPFKKQVYFTSYFSKKLGHSVGTTVFSYRFFEDMANRTNTFRGMDCTVDVGEYFDPQTGEFKKTLRATCIAKREGRSDQTFVAWYPEYVQTDFGGKPNSIWQSKPHLMLRKCAIAGALRSQFPETLGTFLIEEEFSTVDEPIEIETQIAKAEIEVKKEVEALEHIETKADKKELIEVIKTICGKITSGRTPAQKMEFIKNVLLIDSFDRLQKETKERLKERITELDVILSAPIIE